MRILFSFISVFWCLVPFCIFSPLIGEPHFLGISRRVKPDPELAAYIGIGDLKVGQFARVNSSPASFCKKSPLLTLQNFTKTLITCAHTKFFRKPTHNRHYIDNIIMIKRRVIINSTRIFRRWQSSSNNSNNNNNNVPSEKSNRIISKDYGPNRVQIHQRVTYEYPPPPDPEPNKPVEGSAFRKHMPLIAAIGGVAWAAYAYKHYISDNSTSEKQSHLAPEHFVTFKITYKQNLTDELAVLELSPKYETFQKFIKSKGGLWNGKKLWSVDVKQPEIQVVRKYTPLPLYYQQYYEGSEPKALLRMIGNTEDEGRMCLLVKKYDDGEVSRYLHRLEVGEEVELRGPFVGYKFPYAPIDSTEPRDPMEDLPSRMLPEYALPENIPRPDNIAFFAGGTGIAPILQSLLSHNPPRGKVDVYLSVRDGKEIPFSRFLLFLEKAGRAKFHYFVDNERKMVKVKDVPEPVAKNYIPNSGVDKEIEHELKLKQAMDEIRREKYGIENKEKKEEVEMVPVVNKAASAPLDTPVNVSDTAAQSSTSPSSSKKDELGPRRKYRSILEQVADTPEDKTGPAQAIVCGPEGYINYVAGVRGPTGQAPIGGILGQKGWTVENAFRMES